jgi:hypothetical protein
MPFLIVRKVSSGEVSICRGAAEFESDPDYTTAGPYRTRKQACAAFLALPDDVRASLYPGASPCDSRSTDC